jgi:hypothetical protein
VDKILKGANVGASGWVPYSLGPNFEEQILSWKALQIAANLGLLFTTCHAMAQKPSCEVAPFSGASSPQGTVATMSVVNDGQPCGITLYGVPEERRNPATDGVISVAPKHGKAEFVGSRVQYTPEPGYVGEDEFSCQAWAIGASRRSVPLKVRMKVQIHAKQ